MQMTAKPNQLPGNKNPPTPLVQTPISADGGESLHSRNPSASSQLSSGQSVDRTVSTVQQQHPQQAQSNAIAGGDTTAPATTAALAQ